MEGPRLDTVRLQGLARAYCQYAVLYTALDIALFTLVANGHGTEPKLARALDISPLNVERLVTVCLAMGLLTL